MRRSYKFLLRPNAEQRTKLGEAVEDHRMLYNAALQERRDAYHSHHVQLGFASQSAQLKYIRRDDPDGQGRWSSSSQQATLRRLDKAFQAFFKRARSGRTPGFPRFKGRDRFDTIVWPSNGDGCRWDSRPSTGRTTVYLQGIGHIRVHAHRPVDGIIKTVSAKREQHRWFVVLSCDNVPAVPLPRTGDTVGVDMGVASLLTTSTRVQVPTPQFLDLLAERIAEAQRDTARRRRGSNRRRQAHEHVTSLYAKLRRQRKDHAQKLALWLVRNYDLIAHEDLDVTAMVRSAAGTVDNPGTQVRSKSELNRRILDANWRAFLDTLAAAAEKYGKETIAVNPCNTSRTCPRCRHVAAENRRSQAEFICVQCGYNDHADIVGAQNIHRAGLARQARKAA